MPDLPEAAESGPEVWLAMDAIAVLADEATEFGNDFLSLQERARLAAVSGPRDRAAFLAGRLLMRRLLARVHGGDPFSDWPLSATSDDAPAFIGQAFVQRPDAAWQMSIGHGGPYVACAVSSGRVALDLRAAQSGPEREAPVAGPGDVMLASRELLALRDMDDDDRELYFQALRALEEATVKCEAARAHPGALRRLAQRDITPRQWAGELPALHDADRRARWKGGDEGSAPAMAWTWQGDGLTLAVVVPGAARLPQWALPPPPFGLLPPVAWTLRVVPDAPP